MGKMVKANAENRNSIWYGAKVRVNPAYGSGTKYFLCYLPSCGCMLSDGKRDLRDGYGRIYSLFDIYAFEDSE